MTIACAFLLFAVPACGDEDGTSDAPTTAPSATGDTSPAGSDETTPPGGGGGGDVGSLTLGDETIAFDSARCFLQEQEAAAGGGTIDFTGQAFGTNADGEEVSIDVTRFGEESQFAGDDVSVVIGDPFSDDAESMLSSSPIGTVSLDGSVLSASGITFRDDQFNEIPGSFVINC